MHGKTGYIDGVSALAGVAESPSGVRYAFAFLMNDWDITGAKATQDRIVTMLAKGAMDPPAQPGVTTR
ncbi:MAG: D-alanyl-D-alanine carboxypeptidase [Thermoleophilia bacterium]